MIEHVHPAGEPTPTVLELYERRDGSAEVATWTAGSKTEKPKPSTYRLLPKGQQVISEIAARNAAATKVRGTLIEEGIAAVHAVAKRGGSDGSKSA